MMSKVLNGKTPKFWKQFQTFRAFSFFSGFLSLHARTRIIETAWLTRHKVDNETDFLVPGVSFAYFCRRAERRERVYIRAKMFYDENTTLGKASEVFTKVLPKSARSFTNANGRATTGRKCSTQGRRISR